MIVSQRKGGTLVPALAAGLKLIEGQKDSRMVQATSPAMGALDGEDIEPPEDAVMDDGLSADEH